MKEQVTKKTLASLALFRRLYDEKKSNIFMILCEFIKGVIHNKSLRSFNITQIKCLLKSEYNFIIPEYVILTCLKKICNNNNGQYSLISDGNEIANNNHFSEEIDDNINSNNIIINKLLKYVESKTKRAITDGEKEELIQSFCDFLIEETTDIKYAEYISAFILDLEKDGNYTKQLNTIKEGVVLYTSISYNDKLNEIGSWSTELTIYTEQEILFHLAGYNGTLYKDLFEDLYSLIKEINDSSHRKGEKTLIKIKYFPETQQEIDKFFAKAEKIVDGKEILNISNQAMNEITNGCISSSDVITKRSQFYSLLQENSITVEENKDYYSDFNKPYNIERLDLTSLNKTQCYKVSISKEFSEEDLQNKLRLLNYININRRGNNHCGFENVRYILLSGSTITLKLAFCEELRSNGDVPLATNLNFLTNRLWFKLNKGFGSEKYPKNFDVITKAQIILSSQITESVSKEFERLKVKRENGDLSHEDEIASLAELKCRMHKPEEINQENTNTIIETIQISDIERYLRERELERIKAKEEFERNRELNGLIEKSNQENIELSKSLCKIKKDEIKQIDARIDEMEKRKDKADRHIRNRMYLIRFIPFCLVLTIMIFIVLLVYCNGWEDDYYLMIFIPALITYFLFAITGHKWNILQYINVDIKQKIISKTYEERDVHLDVLNDLKFTKRQKEKEL